MKPNLTKRELILIAAIAVLLIFMRQGCSRLADTQASYKLALTNYADVAKKRLADSSLLVSAQLQIDESEREIERLVYLASKTETKRPVAAVLASIGAVIHDTVYLDKPVLFDSVPHLKLPAPFQKHTRWYSFTGSVTETGYLLMDTISINAELTWTIGDTVRSGFFNRLLLKRDKVVRLHIDNPYIDVKGVEAIVKQPKRRVWPIFTGGALVGFMIRSQIN